MKVPSHMDLKHFWKQKIALGIVFVFIALANSPMQRNIAKTQPESGLSLSGLRQSTLACQPGKTLASQLSTEVWATTASFTPYRIRPRITLCSSIQPAAGTDVKQPHHWGQQANWSNAGKNKSYTKAMAVETEWKGQMWEKTKNQNRQDDMTD